MCFQHLLGFLNSREKAQRNFHRQMMKTQFFSRFIDERCFVSDENVGLAFFDECIRKFEEQNDSTLLDFDETSCLRFELRICALNDIINVCLFNQFWGLNSKISLCSMLMQVLVIDITLYSFVLYQRGN